MGVRNGVAYFVSAALLPNHVHVNVLLVSYLPKPTEVSMIFCPGKARRLTHV
jgi:hypothetical protein